MDEYFQKNVTVHSDYCEESIYSETHSVKQDFTWDWFFFCFRKIRIKHRSSNGRWLSLNLALALKCAAAKKRLTIHEICPRFCKEI